MAEHVPGSKIAEQLLTQSGGATMAEIIAAAGGPQYNILKKLEENPEMKEAYRTLVKNLPAEQQEKAIVSLAMRTNRTIAPPVQQQAQAARV